MEIKSIFIISALAYLSGVSANSKMICYYNNLDSVLSPKENCTHAVNKLEKALQLCTHLIYCYANIESSYKVSFKDNATSNNACVREIKSRFPDLKIMASIGGKDDNYKNYKDMGKHESGRLTFINSAVGLLKQHGFDGVDLAIPFNEPEEASFLKNVKYIFQGTSHEKKLKGKRENFSSLLREFKKVILSENYTLSITVLPQVNSSIHLDIKEVVQYVDFVNLLAFDFYTPESSPLTANYPSPLFRAPSCCAHANGDALVSYWINNGAPSGKLIFGISTYVRAWNLVSVRNDGAPPAPAQGAAKEDNVSFSNVCSRLVNPNNLASKDRNPLKRITDLSMRFGPYAYQLPKDNSSGIWIGFDDVDMAGSKASYAHIKGLGGVAIFDITHDDYRGVCTGYNFPILYTAKMRM